MKIRRINIFWISACAEMTENALVTKFCVMLLGTSDCISFRFRDFTNARLLRISFPFF